MPLSTNRFTDEQGREWEQVDGIISTEEELEWARTMIPMPMQMYIHVLDHPGDTPEAVHPDTGVVTAGRPIMIGCWVSWTARVEEAADDTDG